MVIKMKKILTCLHNLKSSSTWSSQETNAMSSSLWSKSIITYLEMYGNDSYVHIHIEQIHI